MELSSLRFDEGTYKLHMFLMQDLLCKKRSVHNLNKRNFDSCDIICGTMVLYSIIWDSYLI